MGWADIVATQASDPWGVFSNAPNSVTGFIGVEFTGATAGGGDGMVYGWIQIAISAIPDANDADGFTIGGLTVLDLAYENMGNPILTGDTGAIPEPSAAGAIALTTLAMGASGLRRRRKSKEASAE